MRLHIQTNHRQKYPRRRAARSSARFGRLFPHTLPILAGFLFLGFAYGLLMRTKGFSFLYPMCMAMTIFGGSLEYVTVSMLLIFGLCDETFSITCSADVPPEVDRSWFYLWVTVLDWCYWVAGAALGGYSADFFRSTPRVLISS